MSLALLRQQLESSPIQRGILNHTPGMHVPSTKDSKLEENFAVSDELFCFLYSLSLTPYLSSYLVCMVYSGQ